MPSCDCERYEKGMGWLGMKNLRAKTWRGVSGDVLEIGMGTGLNRPLYPPNAIVYAFDIDEERVAWACEKRPRHPDLSLTADAQQLPFPSERFDTAVTTITFCSIPAPHQALREVMRVLRPNGRLIMMEHVRGQKPLSRLFTDFFQPLWFALQGECHLNRETAKYVAEVGFEIQQVKSYGVGIMQYIEAVKASEQ